MITELYEGDIDFLANILYQTHLQSLIKKITKSQPHPDCSEMVICKLSIDETKELIGQLCFEANHSKSKRIIEHADYIITSLESQVHMAE